MAKGAKLAFPERKKERMYAKIDIWQSRTARALVILLLVVQPLYLNANRYVRLTWHKFVFFAVCMVVLIIAALIIWAFLWAVSQSPASFKAGRLSS